jgi:O-methyltransferase
VNRGLRKLGVELVRFSPESEPVRQAGLSYARFLRDPAYSPWLDDERFLEIFRAVEGHTLVDVSRCHELWSLARQATSVDGDVLEVGVWRGGTGAVLARAVQSSGKRVFLADTFAGVVKAGSKDNAYIGGEHSDTSEEAVETLLKSLGVTNTVLLKGMFPETNAERVSDQLALVHIDVDVYESARAILRWSLPRLSAGGVIVFDDYGFVTCQGVTRMVNEFVAEDGTCRFVYNVNGHAVLVKIS